MEPEINTTEDIFEKNLENLPQEVKDFLYKRLFVSALEKIASTLGLTEDQKSLLKTQFLLVLSETEQKDSLVELCKKWSLTQEQTKTFVQLSEELIFIPIIEATNYIVIDEPENDQARQTTPTTDQKLVSVSPAQALAAIKDRLTQTASIAPSRRDYSIQKPDLPQEVSMKKSVDPYREKPE